MTLPAPTYDLVLLLDSEAEEQVRTRILGEARAAIEAQGELLRDDVWGDRALSYPIDHKATAKYHLFQFHASTPELLESLDRSLRIVDEVVRFRLIKLKPGTPEAPRTLAAAGETGGAVEDTAAAAPAPPPPRAEPSTPAPAPAEPADAAPAPAEPEAAVEPEAAQPA